MSVGVESVKKDSFSFSEKFNVLWRDNWTSHASRVIRRYEELVIHKAKSEGYAGGEEQDNDTVQWNFSGALLYSVTVITTIGESEAVEFVDFFSHRFLKAPTK